MTKQNKNAAKWMDHLRIKENKYGYKERDRRLNEL